MSCFFFFFFSVTSVKFANDDKTRVACSSIDGTLSVCQVIPPPATVICMLKGHKDGVSGMNLCKSLKCKFVSDNKTRLACSSIDGTLCVKL